MKLKVVYLHLFNFHIFLNEQADVATSGSGRVGVEWCEYREVVNP
jgi:hypothetical protein